VTAPGDGDLLTAFDRHRRLLFSVAYQMLGSVADAEDTVQDAWLRWSAADRGEVAEERAYLVRIASRLALDRLRAARTRREAYVGPWLPEPLLTGSPAAPAAPDPAEAAELGEQVSLAVLVVLETLSPVERAVFVLREVFGMSWAEVAGALDRSEAAVRQLGHRAREHVQARRPRFDADRRARQEVTERFLAACVGGDVEALMAVLAPGVVLMTDGGGRAKAALRPIVGAAKVARFLSAVTPEGLATPGLRLAVAEVNGDPGVVVWSDAGPLLAVSVVVADGVVAEALVMMNPDKLAGIAAVSGPGGPPAGARREPASGGGSGGSSR
jgi:RNA polymerase sigma-70 factor (TIGR02957 family)